MQKILVIGSSGAGKSTCARQLGLILQLPVYHLDRYFWKPNWVHCTQEEFDALLAPLLANDQWIIDGNYGRTLDWRLEYADAVVYLDYPRRIALFRAVKRRFLYHNAVRPDLTEGCPEKFDWGFFKWIWTFRKVHRQQTLELLHRHGSHIHVIQFSTPKKLARWLAQLEGARAVGRSTPHLLAKK